MTSSTSNTTQWTPRLWGALIVLCGALFLDALDVSMVGMALPSIKSDLSLSTSTLQWVVSGYVLGYGGLLLLGGRAADLLGRRRVFLFALGAFAAASLIGGLVDDGTVLIAARFLKGVAAAFTAPAGLSIITTTFAEGPMRNRALSIYTTCGATGFSFGLIVGGALTEVGWRWTFLLPVPIAVIALLAGIRLLPRDRRTENDLVRERHYDLAGAVTATAAMMLLVFGVVQAPTVGFGSAQTILVIAAALALLGLFVTIERRTRNPLVRLGILRSQTLRQANLGALVVQGAYVSFQFVMTLYLQSLLGWSSLKAALAFLPAGLLVVSLAPTIGRFADRFGTRRMLIIGSAAFVAGYAQSLRLGPQAHYLTELLPTLLLLGIGFALSFPALNIQATAGVADEEQGLASGLLNTSFQVGGALVLAVVTAVIGNEVSVSAFRPALAVVVGVAGLGLAVALSGARVRVERVPEPIQIEERALELVD